MTTARREFSVTQLADIAGSSARLIQSFQDASGAYPASPTFSAYRGYSWFRDGAFIADGMSAYGEVESAGRFHDWCSGILVDRRDQIARIVAAAAAGTPVPDAEMLPTRFTLAGDEGDDDWWDFQLDGYGTWAWAVVEHVRRHTLSIEPWREALELASDYLMSSWQRPCFDWWEERTEEVHVSTLGCISAGLRAAAEHLDSDRATRALAVVTEIDALVRQRGVVDGHLTKWLGSVEVDASLLCLVAPLNVFPVSDAIGAATIARIDEQLNFDGGVHRYLADTFFGGGQWPLLSCMLGLALSASGDRDRALDQLRFAASTVTELGEMPEQVGNHLLFPDREQEWIDRWGTVATPLLWSHGMYLRLASELATELGGPR